VVVSRVKVFGREVLYDFIRRHADVRGQVVAWVADVEGAEWKTPQDVRARYPSVSFIGDRRAVFNLKGTQYRLDTSIAFNTGVVAINRMGTHAEYADWTF
jgi:mRNA interferase HigB